MARANSIAATIGRNVPIWNRLIKTRPIGGYANIIANPAYKRLLSAEPWFRGLIPVLVITFLALIGLGNAIQLSKNRAEDLDRNQQLLALMAAKTVFALGDITSELSHATLQGSLSEILARKTMTGAMGHDRVFMMVRDDGLIYAGEPVISAQVGTYLADILTETNALLALGDSAGIQQTTLIGQDVEVFVTVHTLPNGLGSLVAYQPLNSILTPWRADVSLRVSIFIGTTMLLAVVLFAFFSQSSRAEHADTIYHETYTRVEMAFSRARCGLLDWDVERGRFYWSPSMYEILGQPLRKGLLGFGEVDRLVHSEDLDLLEMAEAILTDGLTNIDEVCRMRHADGSWVWIRFRAEVVEHPLTGSRHLVGIGLDVSEQIRLSEEKKTANTRLRESIETLSEAFVLWDKQNRLVVCNDAYRKLNGIPKTLAVAGASYVEIMSEATSPQPALQANLINDGSELENPKEYELDDGRWLQVNEVRTQDDGYVSIATDVTRIKGNQRALKLREQELEVSVLKLQQSERTLRELASKLERQREIAENANVAKTQFLNNISHEWRTPLNAIIGFSEMMRSEALGPIGNERYMEYCTDIHEAGDYMLKFINHVIDMSEIEAGRFKLEPEVVDVSKQIHACIEAVKADAQEHDIEISVKADDTLPLYLDRRAIRQVLLNLTTNALKFNKTAGQVAITTRRDKSHVYIAIADTGIGIAPEALPELGQPFKQVQSQLTKNHTGSGLGLAISKSLVEMHGGSLTIDSILDEGTVVTMKLPIDYKKIADAAE